MDKSNNDNLPRKAMNFDPERAAFRLGLFSVPAVILLAIFQKWDTGDMLLGSVFIPICVGLCATFFFSNAQLLLERFYLRAGNRHKRDHKWLAAWSGERRYELELLETLQDRARHKITLQPIDLTQKQKVDDPGQPSHWYLPRLPPSLASEAQKELAGMGAEIRIESTPTGYLLELEVPLPDAWQAALRPSQEQKRAQQLPVKQLSFSGKDDPGRRPFLLPKVKLLRPKYEQLLALDDALLWFALHYHTMENWVGRVTWGKEDRALFVTCEAQPIVLEQELSYLTQMYETMCLLLAGHRLSLYEQICGFLDHRLFLENDPENATWHARLKEEEVALQWWLFLFDRYHDEEDITAFVIQAIEWTEPSRLSKLFAGAPDEVREGLLLPVLRGFVREDWLAVSQTHSPAPKNDTPGLYRYLFQPYWPEKAHFAEWLELLAHYLSKEEFRVYCESVLTGYFDIEWEPEESWVWALQVCALRCWLESEPPEAQAQLLRWLDELGAEMVPSVLGHLEAQESLGVDVEEALHPWLFAESVELHLGYHIRWRALHILDKVATLRSLEVLERGCKSWHPHEEFDPLPLTKKILARLQKDLLQGGLSLTEEEEEVGQLSLTDDERVEGQLSLEPAADQEEKGRS